MANKWQREKKTNLHNLSMEFQSFQPSRLTYFTWKYYKLSPLENEEEVLDLQIRESGEAGCEHNKL